MGCCNFGINQALAFLLVNLLVKLSINSFLVSLLVKLSINSFLVSLLAKCSINCLLVSLLADIVFLLLGNIRKTSESTAYPHGCVLAHLRSVLYRFRLLFNFVYCCHILISYCVNVRPSSSLCLHFPFLGECLEVF